MPVFRRVFVLMIHEILVVCLLAATVRNDLKRSAGAQILLALVKARPAEFAQHIPRVFQCIFKVC